MTVDNIVVCRGDGIVVKGIEDHKKDLLDMI